jgi:hypothetical protein
MRSLLATRVNERHERHERLIDGLLMLDSSERELANPMRVELATSHSTFLKSQRTWRAPSADISRWTDRGRST